MTGLVLTVFALAFFMIADGLTKREQLAVFLPDSCKWGGGASDKDVDDCNG
jgi:hypothetical protein